MLLEMQGLGCLNLLFRQYHTRLYQASLRLYGSSPFGYDRLNPEQQQKNANNKKMLTKWNHFHLVQK
jgi:hypothetical protein